MCTAGTTQSTPVDGVPASRAAGNSWRSVCTDHSSPLSAAATIVTPCCWVEVSS